MNERCDVSLSPACGRDRSRPEGAFVLRQAASVPETREQGGGMQRGQRGQTPFGA